MGFENLAKIAHTQSLLRENVVSHLERMADSLDTTELYFNDETSTKTEHRCLKISEIAVEPVVITEDLKSIPTRPAADDSEQSKPQTDVIAEIQAAHYERPEQAERFRKEPWKRTLSRKRRLRLAVKGEPGGGKTFITKYTALAMAREEAAKLDDFTGKLETTGIPVWITADELADAYQDNESDLTMVFSALILRQHGETRCIPRFYQWLKEKLSNESGKDFELTIFVDALDEIKGEAHEKSFGKAAKRLFDLPGKVFLLVAKCAGRLCAHCSETGK